jgi:hypothetical protein
MARLEIKRDDIAARLGRREQRSRWPLAGTLVVAGLAGWVVLSNDMIRARLSGMASAIEQRISAIQSTWMASHELDRTDPIAFSAAETMPIATATSTGTATKPATDYPTGFGSNNGGGIATFEIGSPAKRAGTRTPRKTIPSIDSAG